MVSLLLTNSEDATSDFLEFRLISNKNPIIRLNTDEIYNRITVSSISGHLSLEGLFDTALTPQDISAVIYRRPKAIYIPDDVGDQFQRNHLSGEWAEAIEGFLSCIPLPKWINHPTMNYIASHKVEQLSRAQNYGLHTPDTVITNRYEDVKSFYEKHHVTGIIAKSLAGSWIERDLPQNDTFLHTVEITELDDSIFNSINTTPVIFQEKINKKSDVRIIVLDSSIIAVELKRIENGQQSLDIRRDNMSGVKYSVTQIPRQVNNIIFQLIQSYQLRFAVLDFAIDQEGDWIFFEINPNGQWAWLDIEKITNIADFFAESIKNGC